MKKIIFPVLLLSLAACSEVPTKIGSQTRAWTDLQKSGIASTAAPRPMPGEAADKVYERYVNSFGHPIPETYTRESSSGSSGGQGGR
jgi:hypothetical protein